MAIDFLTFPDNGGANGGPTTRMTIDQDGSVGIGTETPAFTLDVNGANANQIGIFRSTDATARVNFVDNSTTSDTHVGIGAVGNALSLWAGNAVALTAAQSGNLSFNSGKLAEYNGAAPTAGQLLIGSAGGGVWEAATLTAGSNVTITNADGAITIAASGGGGGGTPGGANTEVQFNDSGSFGASSNVTYNALADEFTLGGGSGRTTFTHAGSMTINSNGGDGRIQGNSLTIQSANTTIADAPNLNVGFYGSPGINQYTVGDPGLLPPDPAALQAWLIELYNAIGPGGMNIIA